MMNIMAVRKNNIPACALPRPTLSNMHVCSIVQPIQVHVPLFRTQTYFLVYFSSGNVDGQKQDNAFESLSQPIENSICKSFDLAQLDSGYRLHSTSSQFKCVFLVV